MKQHSHSKVDWFQPQTMSVMADVPLRIATGLWIPAIQVRLGWRTSFWNTTIWKQGGLMTHYF